MKGTSLKAYTELEEEGQLGDRQEEVLEELEKYQPCTALELGDLAFPRKTVNYYRPRLTELKDKELITISSKRECQISGRTASTLEITEKGEEVLDR